MPSAGRVHRDLEQQLGFYVNMLVLRDYVEMGISFADFLKNVKQTSVEAMEHELYPFDRLVEDLNLVRDRSRSPLFDVLIVFQDHDPAELSFDDLKLNLESIEWGTSKYDLSFGFIAGKQGLTINIEYNTAIYKLERIQRMFTHLTSLIESVITDINQPIENLNLLPLAEQHLIIDKFSSTTATYDFDKTIHQLFEEQVARTPDNTAIIFEKEILTYRTLNEKANQLAHHLINNYDLKGDDIIALQVERSEWMLIALLGIMKSGGAYLPIAPDYPAARTAYMLKDLSLIHI